jgi:hypothetical protein
MSRDPDVRFVLTGDFALAGYFLMANWPRPETVPELDAPVDAPMSICVSSTPAALGDLRTALARMKAKGGDLARSAETWLRQLEGAGLSREAEPHASSADARQG